MCGQHGGAVHCYHADGALIGRIKVPEGVANVAFGGLNRTRLYIAATTSLYSVDRCLTRFNSGP